MKSKPDSTKRPADVGGIDEAIPLREPDQELMIAQGQYSIQSKRSFPNNQDDFE